MDETPINPLENFNKEDAEIGLIGNPPEIFVLSLPIAKYAKDEINGTALLYGKIREAQAQAMQILTRMRQKQAQAGLLKPNGNLAIH